MIEPIKRFIPKGFHPYILPAYKSVLKRIDRLDRAIDKRTLTEADFGALLKALGFAPGAVVFVHSSMDELSRRLPGVSPTRVIHIMQQMVGPEGTLLFPTFPFQGLQVRYAETHHRFDVRRTPSQVGLITEVFRRLPGVVRSLHPTHPVAAWGRHAQALTEGHHLGGTFGPASPICKIREYGGLVVGIGTRIGKFTIAHVPEELHSRAHAYCFENSSRPMVIIDGDRTLTYELRCLRSGIDRDYGPLESTLVKEGILRNLSVSGLRCAVVPANEFIRRSMELIDSGGYLFKVSA